ncbi:hypothetical protein HM1_1234 [Heliomicrobium modesticaldum Ice1]|uniref:Uncharacterized protein n=1 Tax=Heliobacterium modesticaldum (strain ATCC 51547 / Ice1) TaxID=498761 RepID=B0TH17_HELMI|nr:hypothetical protein HM1_1234 [Heliomicrobium modesticaldum Ice1]
MAELERLSAAVNLWEHCNFNCSFCLGARANVPQDWASYR